MIPVLVGAVRPLLLRPVYGEGESPLSFLSRLAMKNGKAARDFCSDFGIHFQDLVDGRHAALLRLAELGGVPFERLRDAAMARRGLRDYVWRGQRLAMGALRRLRLRVCPLCLIDDARDAARGLGPEPYGRTLWLVSHLRLCPIHGVMLVELPSSGATTHDFARTLAQAPSDLLTPGARSRERALTDFEGYLRARLSGSPDPGTPWLNAIDFTAAAELCEVMGAIIAFGRRVGVGALDEAALHLSGDLGFQVARLGPEGIREMLTAWDGGASDVDPVAGQPSDTYGPLRSFLFGRHRRPELDPVRDAVADHVMRSTPVGPGETVLGRSVPTRRLHSVASASRETGTSVTTIRRILREAGAIDPASDGLPARAVVFDASTHAPLLRAISHAVLIGDVGRHLGCGARVARQLAASGTIRPIPLGAVNTAVRTRIFDVDTLHRLVRDLSASAEAMADGRPGTCGISEAARRAKCPMAMVVALILARRLAWVGRREQVDGFAAIRVRVSEVKRLAGGGDSDLLTPIEAGEEVGIGHRRISALIDAGLIVDERDPECPRPLRRPRSVRRGEARRFRATYLTLGQVGEAWGRHPNRCRTDLRAAGVVPVFVCMSPPFTLYRRADVNRILGERPQDPRPVSAPP